MLKLRFGLGRPGQPALSQEATAATMKVHREVVRRLEAEALAKLRAAFGVAGAAAAVRMILLSA